MLRRSLANLRGRRIRAESGHRHSRIHRQFSEEQVKCDKRKVSEKDGEGQFIFFCAIELHERARFSVKSDESRTMMPMACCPSLNYFEWESNSSQIEAKVENNCKVNKSQRKSMNPVCLKSKLVSRVMSIECCRKKFFVISCLPLQCADFPARQFVSKIPNSQSLRVDNRDSNAAPLDVLHWRWRPAKNRRVSSLPAAGGPRQRDAKAVSSRFHKHL